MPIKLFGAFELYGIKEDKMKTGKIAFRALASGLYVVGLLYHPCWLKTETPDAGVSNKQQELSYRGPKIVVNVVARRLRVYDEHDNLVVEYPVAVGSPEYKTPLGKRELVQIVWNPWWYPPKSTWAKHERITPPGKHNPLGPVKMKLDGDIMFHGTNKPRSVGKAASHGCMRLHNDDAKKLASWLQLQVMGNTNNGFFEKVERSRTKSFYVQLEHPIPVDIVYEPVEIKGGKLHMYSDVYHKTFNKIGEIEKYLESNGYQVKEVHWDVVTKKLKAAHGHEDLKFSLEEIGVKGKVL
jgi:L,D-transpeptidase-like protein